MTENFKVSDNQVGGHNGHGSHDYNRINQTHKLSFATCLLWAKDQFRTFDGTFFQFPGDCTYKLSSSGSWQINVKFEKCDDCETCNKVTT